MRSIHFSTPVFSPVLARVLARVFIGALLLAAAASCAALVTPEPVATRKALRDGAYSLDGAHASVVFKIDHLGFSTYVGRFEALDARLDFDADDPGAARLEAVIEMGSLDIANDEFAATLAGPDWFDAAQYPEARFVSRSIEITGENTGIISGELTLKGVTRPVALATTFNGGARDLIRGAYVVGFSATTTIDRTAFGVSAFSGVIADDVRLEIEAEFLRQ